MSNLVVKGSEGGCWAAVVVVRDGHLSGGQVNNR